MGTRFNKNRTKITILTFLNIVIAAALFFLASFVFSFVGAESFLRPASGQYRFYYGLDFIAPAFSDIASAFTFQKSVILSIVVYLLLLSLLVALIVPIIKRRFQLLIHLVTISLTVIFGYIIADFFFGSFLQYEGQPVSYFNLLMLNSSMHLVVVIYYWIVFILFAVAVIDAVLLAIFIVLVNTRVGEGKIDKYEQRKFERSYPNVKEVRKITEEEIAKYIKNHRTEVLEMLGFVRTSQVNGASTPHNEENKHEN